MNLPPLFGSLPPALLMKFAETPHDNDDDVGGWIHKMLKDGMTVVTDECDSNRIHTQRYAKDFGNQFHRKKEKNNFNVLISHF